MSKLKLVEIVLMAANALIMAAKSVVKLIDYLGKLKQKPNKCMA